MSSTRGRKVVWFMAGAALLLVAATALDPSGLRKHLELREAVARMRTENRVLELDNARLAREARALRSTPAAIERAAREELRFVRPGEIVYRLDATGATP
jgi:cell division protein FtsB